MHLSEDMRTFLQEQGVGISTIREIDGEIKSAYDAGYAAGGVGKITMDEARSLASTYDGGEGSHPLARHRDSMG